MKFKRKITKNKRQKQIKNICDWYHKERNPIRKAKLQRRLEKILGAEEAVAQLTFWELEK